MKDFLKSENIDCIFKIYSADNEQQFYCSTVLDYGEGKLLNDGHFYSKCDCFLDCPQRRFLIFKEKIKELI